MTNKRKLWNETYIEIRNILVYALLFNLSILVFSGFKIILAINFILNLGIIIYLDLIK